MPKALVENKHSLVAAAVASAVSKTDVRKANRVGAPAPKVTEAELVRRREEERPVPPSSSS